ncbi:MAG: SufE family protein [Candidatus Promineifilaceae bacterium]|nr:SufE family protein [Candidatus Promineifilaceae bacterium]
MSTNEMPPRLAALVEDFSYCVGQEKLEYLLDLAQGLAPLPPRLHDQRDQMDEVHECMTPVFIHAEATDNQMHYFFDVPAESPTVRGFAALLGEGLNGASPSQIIAVPSEFYLDTGLQSVLSAQRLSGLSAILVHMKKLATPHLDGRSQPDAN